MVCMASFLSSNGRISVHFDNIHLKLSTYVYSMVPSHSMRSKSKTLKIYFYDVITNEFHHKVIGRGDGET